MNDVDDNLRLQSVAGSATIGLLATLIQELVASGAINGEILRQKLTAFGTQDSVTSLPDDEKNIISWAIDGVLMGVEIGEREKKNGRS